MEPYLAPSRNQTWWWFLVPSLTLGAASFVMVFLGGYRLKSRKHMIAAGFYLLTNGFCVAGIALSPTTGGPNPQEAPSTTAALAMLTFLMVAWFGGTLHTLLLQAQIGKLPAEPRP